MASANTYLLKEDSFELSEEDEDSDDEDNEMFNSSADIRHVKRWPPLGATTSSSPINHSNEHETQAE